MKTSITRLAFGRLASICFLIITSTTLLAQGVGINSTGAMADPSAMLDVSSTDRGVLVSRMTESQRDNISNPATGLLIYNTDTDCFNMWNGSSWKQFCGSCNFANPVAGNNGPLCEGQTINLSASSIPGAVYSWTGPNGFSSTSQNPSISSATLANAGSYTVTATLNGCTSDPVGTVVTVNSAPSTPTAGSNSPVCAGSSLNLTASTIVGASYSWTGPNGFSSTSQNPILGNPTTAASGVYSVTASQNGCTSSAATTNVTVNALPTANAGNDTTIADGGSASLNASGGISYNWSTGATTQGITVNPTQTTLYTVTVTDANGCTASDDVNVSIAMSERHFTNCNNIGRLGPDQSQCNSAYSGGPLDGEVTVNAGIQLWTVPQNGTYSIEAAGAAGGAWSNNTYTPGYGASVTGEFALTAGETLYILVGQRGETRLSNPNHGGGGGGTYVYKNVNDIVPLVAAGGGTGSVYNSNGDNGSATVTPGTGNGAGAAAGGSGGNGGNGSVGGGGAGWSSDGDNGTVSSYNGTGGKAPRNGGAGGDGQPTGYGDSADGGFGGGGSGGNQYGASGGGGGYNGGGGGINWNGSSWGAGGGGGSYNGGGNQLNTPGANNDHGYVKINFVGP